MSEQDFFAPEYVDKTFERNGKSGTFRVRELTGEEAESLFDITDKNGNADPAKSKGLNARIIALAVCDLIDTGPQAISLEKAKHMPAKLLRGLVRVFMDLNSMSESESEVTEQD